MQESGVTRDTQPAALASVQQNQQRRSAPRLSAAALGLFQAQGLTR